MRADACFTQWDVEFAAAATFSRASRLAPLFGLIFRRSSCQHPLLAGALGKFGAYTSLIALMDMIHNNNGASMADGTSLTVLTTSHQWNQWLGMYCWVYVPHLLERLSVWWHTGQASVADMHKFRLMACSGSGSDGPQAILIITLTTCIQFPQVVPLDVCRANDDL